MPREGLCRERKQEVHGEALDEKVRGGTMEEMSLESRP